MSDDFGISAHIGGDDSEFQSTFARVESSLTQWGFDFDKLYGRADEFMKGFGIDIDQFASKIGTTGPELAAGLGVAVIAFEAVKEVIIETSKEFAQAEVAEIKFNAAIAANATMNDKSRASMSELVDQISHITGQTEEQTRAQIAQLAAQGRSEEQIRGIMRAALGMANEGIMPLDEAIKTLGMSFEGNAGRLGRYSAEVRALTPVQLANGQAVDILSQKYGQFSGILADSSQVSMSNFSNSINKVKEVMGKFFEETIKPLRDALTSLFDYLSKPENTEKIVTTLEAIGTGIALIIGLFNPVLGAIALVVTAVFALAHAAGNLKILWLDIEYGAVLMGKGIMDAFSSLANSVIDLINKLITAYDQIIVKVHGKPLGLISDIDISKAWGLNDALKAINDSIDKEKEKLKNQPKGGAIGKVDVPDYATSTITTAQEVYARSIKNTKNELDAFIITKQEADAQNKSSAEALVKTLADAGLANTKAFNDAADAYKSFNAIIGQDTAYADMLSNRQKKYEEYIAREKEQRKFEDEENRKSIEASAQANIAKRNDSIQFAAQFGALAKSIATVALAGYSEDLEYFKKINDAKRKIDIDEAIRLKETDEEIAKINSFYDDQVVEYERKQSVNRINNYIQLGKDILDTMQKVSSGITTSIKDLAEKAGSLIKGMVTLLTDTFNIAWVGFNAIIDFDPSNMFQSLSDSLSKVYAAFTQYIPDLPQIVQTAFNLIETFITNLVNNSGVIITGISEKIPQALQMIVDDLPTIFAQVGPLLASIGTAIISAAPAIISSIGSILVSMGNAIISAMPTILTDLGTLLAALAQGIITYGPTLVTDFVTIVLGLAKVIIEQLPAFVTAFVTLLESFVTAMAQQLPGIITALINSLSEIITTISNSLPEFIAAFLSLFEAILTNLPEWIIQIASSLATNITTIVQAIANAFPQFVKSIADNLPQIITALINGLIMIGLSLIDNLPIILDAIIKATPDIVEAVIGIIPAIIVALIEAFPAIVVALATLIYDLVTIDIPDAFVGIYQVGENVILGLISGIVDIGATIWDSIKSVFTTMWNAILSFFGISSPSTLAASAGGDIINGLINGITTVGATIWNSVKSVFTGLWNNITSIFSGIGSWFSSTFSSISSGISSAVSSVSKNLSGAVSAVSEFASSGWSAISSGVSSAVSAVGSFFSGLFAEGTTDYPGGVGIGGEQGPEMYSTLSGAVGLIGTQGPQMFSLPKGSTITPASNTASMLGGGGTSKSVSVSINAGAKVSLWEANRAAESLSRKLAFSMR